MELELIMRLNETLRQASKSNFYTKRLDNVELNSISEFSKLPITTKEDLRKLNVMDALSVNKEMLYQYHESFGTTGDPVPVWFTKNDFNAYADQLNEFGVRFNNNDIVLIRFPYAISVPAHIFTKAIHQKEGCVIPVSKESLISPMKRVINLICKLKPTIITGIPEELIKINLVAEHMGISLKELKSIRAICTAGEMLSDARKKSLEDIYGAKVYNYYGCTEAGNIAATCDHGHLHISKDFYVEILDRYTLKPIIGEKGKVVVTTLNKEAFPLIRYDLGDIGEILLEKCSCGCERPIIISHGRECDLIRVGDIELTLKEVQEQFLKLPREIIGDIFRIKIKNDSLIFQCEGEKELERSINKYNIDLPISFEIQILNKGEIIDIEKLSEVKLVAKPKYIEYL